jgi:GNAT superfamily N-acetyltransferase
MKGAPDETLQLTAGNAVVACCSCWWTSVPVLEGRRLGVIGHYSAADAVSSAALLKEACDLLASRGCDTAVGPMDGSTWRRYRFIVERGTEPPFFLEPDNPDDWPAHWAAAGFETLATYTSGLNDDLAQTDPRTGERRERLAGAGITIRTFDVAGADRELRRMFALSLTAFSRNVLYTPISEAEFLSQQASLLPYVRPELVLLAEQEDRLVGYMFAVPDALEAQRGGRAATVIMKTMAVDPSVGGIGLGGTLFDLAQRSAHQLGFRRAIHALMHETNASGRISGRYARTIRRYALFSRRLAG